MSSFPAAPNKFGGDSFPHGGHEKGLGWFITALFLVSDMAGGGLVALPTAMVRSGFWTGILLSVVMNFVFMYTSRSLGKCWVILQRRWPSSYRSQHCRQPYPEIGARACGPKLRTAVAACIDLNQFSTTTVYLLLSAKNIHDALKALLGLNISFCLLLILLVLVLLPLIFLNSPVDFWGAAVVAVCTTTIAVVLICLGTFWDLGTCSQHHSMPEFRPTNYFLAWTCGGPDDFHKSSMLAFGILFAMYTPVCVLGFLAYGDSLRESVINSLQHSWIQQSVNVMITLHLIVTILIVNNPLNQKLEEIFHVPHEFGWKRVVVRSSMMALVLLVAETVPTFGPLLDLVGGSVLMLTSLVFPCLFFLFLNAGEQLAIERQKSPKANGSNGGLAIVGEYGDETTEENQRAGWRNVVESTDRCTLFLCLSIIASGCIGGVAATFSAVRSLSFTHFVPPCYLSAMFPEAKTPNAGGYANCCGHFQNISITATPESCSPPNLNFYD
uniref:Amino acid transporter transmembrane domain-containing protein n=1 Tax=Globodera rostochiensis TaxID=31243 RepID=A0A914I0J2_GLORO